MKRKSGAVSRRPGHCKKLTAPAVAETVVDGLTNENEKLSQADRAAIAAYAARATWPSGFMVYESASRADGVFVVLRGCIVQIGRASCRERVEISDVVSALTI